MISAKGIGAVVVPMLACVAQPALAQSIQFHVARQAAVTGVPEFARQAHVQIVSPASGLASLQTQAVNGKLTVDEGLRTLLKGTGLHVAMRNGSTISLAAALEQHDAPRLARPRAAAMAEAAPDVPAPEAEAEPIHEIIVSGTRNRLSAAPQDEKRKSMAMVTTVGSEEMSKRTDVSVVAALERLPGIVRQRGTQTSQAWYPAIRGFTAMYNSVTLDGGMLYLSTRNQRGVPLDFIPSAIVNEIVVNKTITSDMDPNSIGGHIDVRTLRSFDNNGKLLTMLDVQAANYTQAGAIHGANPSYAINGVIKRTFGDGGNFGFVLAGSTHKDQYNEYTNATAAYVQQNGQDVPSGNVQSGNYNSRAHGFSTMAKLEGRGETWYSYLAANYFQERIWRDLARTNLLMVPANSTATSGNTGTFTSATPSALSQIYYNDRKIFSIRSGLEYQTDETSKLVVNASYLKANFREGFWTGAAINGPAVSGAYSLSDRAVTSAITGSSALSDPTQWTQGASATAAQVEYPLHTDILTSRVEYKSNDFDFSKGFGFDAGVDFRQMWRRLDQYETDYTLKSGNTLNLSQVMSDGTAFNGSNPNQAIYVDSSKYWTLVGALGNATTSLAVTSNYNLSEMVVAPFVAAYVTTDKFRVIVGGRYNITHYTDSSANITGGVVSPFTITRTMPVFLPNVQGYYNITRNFRIRAAYTQTTALQNYSVFAMGTTTNYDGKGNPIIQGSNPYLKPRNAFNEDISLEWYLPKGYVSLGWFHKTITNEVQSVTVNNYNASGVLTSQVSTPINAGGEHTQGIEFESNWHDFTGVSPLLRGLSLDVNGAWFDSNTTALTSAGVQRTVKGLSMQPKWVANVIATYDRGPLSFSLAGQSRGRGFLSFGSIAANDTYIAPYTTLDAKVGYQAFRNVKVYFEGRNLTNYWYKEVYGVNGNHVSTSIKSGPTYVVGAKINF